MPSPAITTWAPARSAAAIRSGAAAAPVRMSVGTRGEVNSGSVKSSSRLAVTIAIAGTGVCPAASRAPANSSRTRAGRYPSCRTVSAPTTTTSASARSVPKTRMSVALEMGCERPSCWAAPSSEETMLARSHGRGAPGAGSG